MLDLFCFVPPFAFAVLAGNKREVIRQKQTIAYLRIQLDNVKETGSIIPPIKSLKSIGMSKKLLSILSLFVGLIAGVFAAFIAWLLNIAKVEIESN